MAKLLTTKRALICLLFLAILLVALYSFLLDRKAITVHLQDRVLRSESGRLVARSQFNFHHIVEQWVQPGGKRNHSARRKERLIEDGQVIKEAFDYGESENENADVLQQNKLNFHASQLANISSRHKNNEKQLHQELGLARSKNVSRNKSLTSLAQAKQQPDDTKQPQSPLLRSSSSHNESIVHRSVVDKRISNGTKSTEIGNNFSGVEGHSKTEVKLHTKNVEFTNLHVQRSDNHGDTGSRQTEGEGAVDAQANLQPSSKSRKGEGKGAVVETRLKVESSLTESKVKPDYRNPPHELVPVRSDHKSDGNTALDAQRKNGVLSEKPDLQATADSTQVKHGEGKPSESKIISNREAQVKPGSELEAVDGHIPARHKVLSYKPDAVDGDAQMPLGSEREESTRHEQLSKLKRDIRAQVPVALDSVDTQAAAHRPVSELKTKSGVAKQAPLKKTDQTLAKTNLKTKGATVNKHIQKVKPAVTSKNASKNYQVYRPPPELKTGLKSADLSSASERTQVMYVNSHGRTIRVVKRQNNASPKTRSTQQQQLQQKKYRKQADHTRARVNPAPSLVINGSSPSYTRRGTNPFDQENFDFDSDPRYAHLPPAVKKKLAEIRNNRLSRIKFVRLIRKHCEGKKYCVQHVKSNERALHDNCFYDAIMAEEKDGIELNPCQCSLRYSTGRGSISRLSHGVVSSAEVYSVLPLIALVSLPGSGNTWVRGLLEEATGYCTGSMWCDPILRAKQFCAEGIRSNTLVVKNHDAKIRWLNEKLSVNSSDFVKPSFSSAIFVHRDPYEATIAEWNRALGFQVYNATKHNLTVAGIGYYNATAVKDQHTVSFGKEAFGT
jgi:hypothetical protein